jgi:hypothetical protein
MMTKDNLPVLRTTATWAGTNIQNTNADVGIDGATNYQAPYTGTEFNTKDISCRVVACGLRVRYQGTELNRGGTIVLARQPESRTIDDAPVSELLSWQPTSRVPCTRTWHHINWRPTNNFEYNFQQSNGVGAFNIVIAVSGAEPGNVFEYEIVTFLEYCGQVPDVTPSHSDVNGMSLILSNLPANHPVGSSTAEHKMVEKGALSDLWDSFTGFMPQLATVVEDAGRVASVVAPFF